MTGLVSLLHMLGRMAEALNTTCDMLFGQAGIGALQTVNSGICTLCICFRTSTHQVASDRRLYLTTEIADVGAGAAYK